MKKNANKLLLILAFAILLRIIFVIFNLHNPSFDFQQEHYTQYIAALKSNSINSMGFPETEKRLFPGYIILILGLSLIINSTIVSGIVISIIAFILSYILVWKIFKNLLTNFIFAFFPPVWVIQTTKSATEPITVLFLLSSLYFFLKKSYFLTGIFIGLALNIRLISITLLFVFIFKLLKNKMHKESINLLIGFLLTSSILLMFNYMVFGQKNLFIQFVNIKGNYGTQTLGIIQIVKDIYRTIDWHQYRILFSGLFYLIINIFGLFLLFKFRKLSNLYDICFYWFLFSLIFIFTFSPFTLIENFGRYTAPLLAPLAYAYSTLISKLIKRFMRHLPKLSSY